MEPVHVKLNPYVESSKEMYDKHPKFKIGDADIKISLKKVTLQIGEKEFLWLKKLKYCALDI